MLNNSYEQKERDYYEYSRVEMRPFIPVGTRRLLDVGCGQGNFARHFKESASVETWGVEMMSQAAGKAETVLHRVFCGDFQTIAPNMPEKYFDAIVFNDVLEHMLEPEQALNAAAPLLSPQGAVVASVPNFIFWPNLRKLIMTRDFQYSDTGILDRTHLRFFTQKSILRLFTSSGYIVERCEGINLYPWTWRSRWLLSLLKSHAADFSPAQYAVVARPRM